MGIYISKEKDEELYAQVANEVDRIKRGSEHRTISVQKVEAKKTERPKQQMTKVESLKDEDKPVSSKTKFFSTTALSKEVGLSNKDLLNKFEKLNWIERKDNDWVLTPQGKNKGALIKKGQYGEYIAWPETSIKDII
jgi:hypothetical protein